MYRSIAGHLASLPSYSAYSSKPTHCSSLKYQVPRVQFPLSQNRRNQILPLRFQGRPYFCLYRLASWLAPPAALSPDISDSIGTAFDAAATSSETHAHGGAAADGADSDCGQEAPARAGGGFDGIALLPVRRLAQ